MVTWVGFRSHRFRRLHRCGNLRNEPKRSAREFKVQRFRFKVDLREMSALSAKSVQSADDRTFVPFVSFCSNFENYQTKPTAPEYVWTLPFPLLPSRRGRPRYSRNRTPQGIRLRHSTGIGGAH